VSVRNLVPSSEAKHCFCYVLRDEQLHFLYIKHRMDRLLIALIVVVVLLIGLGILILQRLWLTY
jgi:hypothetical protein